MLTNRPARIAILLGLSLLAGACSGPASPSPKLNGSPVGPGASPSLRAASSAPSSPSAGPGGTPVPSTATPSASLAPTCAMHTLDQLNEGQRVGQLFLLGLANDKLGPAEVAAIETDHFGSVWFTATSHAGTSAIRSVANAVQALKAASSAGPGTAGIGFFVAANQEGGLVQALQGPGFTVIPSALAQGALSTGKVESRSAEWGAQLKAAGVNLNFAPVTDVVPAATAAQNQPIGALQREYGHTPGTAGPHAAAFMQGMTQAGIVTVAKHFPGLGRVVGNTDFSADVIDNVTSVGDPYLGSFQDVISAGVPVVMVALATYTRIDPAHLAAFSSVVIQELLRGQLGFSGVVMSDDLGATVAVEDVPPATRGLEFIAAGGDMIISKTIGPAEAMAVAITARTSTDPAFRNLVNAAALRVLQLKATAHLLPCGSP
jgi:beta-N-acetylhexosaminidase